MRAGVKKFLEPLPRLRDGIRPRNTDRIEAQRARGFNQLGLQRVRCQKSRLA